MKTKYIILGVLILVCTIGSCSYNGMVTKEELVKAKWSSLQSQYQRRSDLVQNLVETVKGSANFEKSTLVDVTNSRAKATSMQINVDKLSQEEIQKFQFAQGQLSNALSRLLVASENYPTLRASDNFTALQKQLESTENRINIARIDFNGAVQDYNINIKSFPDVLIARLLGFREHEPFQAEAGVNLVPKVSF